jgi:transcription antitermination factor NusA-like protein
MSSVAAAEAIARAKIIAARLSAQAEPHNYVALPSGSASASTNGGTERNDGGGERRAKRKRWAKEDSASAENAGYRSMALPSQVLAAAARAVPTHGDLYNQNIGADRDNYTVDGDPAPSTNNAITGIDSSSSIRPVTTYTPKPVAQILGLGSGFYGENNDALVLRRSADVIEEIMYVPNGVVGYIIGRGGENISSMQRKTMCKVQIQKESEMNDDPTHANKQERKITLVGPNHNAVSECRTIIESMVAERRQQLNGPKMGGMGVVVGANVDAAEEKFQLAVAQGHAHMQIQIPDKDVGLVIGRQGINIKNIQDRTGASVQIPNKADDGNGSVRTCNITCPTMDGAQQAQQMVQDILDKHAMYHGNTNNGGGAFMGAVGNTPGLGSQHSISVAVSKELSSLSN